MLTTDALYAFTRGVNDSGAVSAGAEAGRIVKMNAQTWMIDRDLKEDLRTEV
jgi:uncharacterized membrane protein